MLDRTENSRAVIGDNQCPGAIELAEPTIEALNRFLRDNPVIGNEDEAREAKPHLDRMVAALKAIDDERKAAVDPLNKEVKTINATYHKWHNTDANRPGLWDKLLTELRTRLSTFARHEEQKRREAAEAARAAAAEAKRKAREAEEREREAAATAAVGICEVNIAAATEQADQAFRDFQRADREAARAERNATVRIGGGFGKVSTLRTVEVLTVTDWRTAIEDMTGESGAPPTVVIDAILTAARAYRRENNELPSGISATHERRI
jgi:hypothetical protein